MKVYEYLKSVFLILIPIVAVHSPNMITSAQVAEPDSGSALGELQFSNSCSAAVSNSFNTAVAMLHSFEFEESKRVFEQVAEEDPTCAMAYWGIAMTYYHPLWAPPSELEFGFGAAAVEEAQNLASDISQREQDYIDAIASFYTNADDTTHRERAQRYEQAMARLVATHSNDREAEIFYALAQLSNADPRDKSYTVQKQVGALLEQWFTEMPNHPGLAHYIIHSYDYPEISDRAVHAADRYLEIASSMPHALHMSGHIYTQLGMWERSVEANLLSVDAAIARAELFELGEGTQNEMHSLDYLVYAYLQQGLNDKALEVVERVASYRGLNLKDGIIAFNSSAIPVRYAIERKDWDVAANIPLLNEEDAANWNDQIVNSQALRYWARVIGAAKRGQIAKAETELLELERIVAATKENERIWGRNTPEVFRMQAAAWLSFAKGENSRAEELLRLAANLEDQTDKSSISPGRVLPAHEQLGDLLLELGRAEEALEEYELSMTFAPERLNSFVGAARAANAANNDELAQYYQQKATIQVVE